MLDMAVTVTMQLAFIFVFSADAAVITATPGDTAVTLPLPSTVAMPGSLEVQMTFLLEAFAV